MAIVIREDNGIKKVGKTFADGSFIEIKAVLDSNGDVDETLSETKLDKAWVIFERRPMISASGIGIFMLKGPKIIFDCVVGYIVSSWEENHAYLI